jgi:hypothetical protein
MNDGKNIYIAVPCAPRWTKCISPGDVHADGSGGYPMPNDDQFSFFDNGGGLRLTNDEAAYIGGGCNQPVCWRAGQDGCAVGIRE